MIIIGVDPGKTGAIGIIGVKASIIDMPDNPHDLAAELRWWGDYAAGDCIAVVEQAQAMPGQGVSSTFQTGYGYGQIIGILAALNIPYQTVRPAQWKQRMGLTREKGQTDRAAKAAARALAMTLWPSLGLQRVKDHGRAEALLIAEDYRRTNKEAN